MNDLSTEGRFGYLFNVQVTRPSRSRWLWFWGAWGVLCGILAIIEQIPDIVNHVVAPISSIAFDLRGVQVILIGLWIAWKQPWSPADIMDQRKGWMLNIISAVLLIPAVGVLLVDSDPWGSVWYYLTLGTMLLQILWLSRRGLVRLAAILLTTSLVIHWLGLGGLNTDLRDVGYVFVYGLIFLIGGVLVRWWFGLIMALFLPLLSTILASLGVTAISPNWNAVFLYVLLLSAYAGIIALYTRTLESALTITDANNIDLKKARDKLSQTIEQLRSNEEQLRTVISNNPVILFVLDRNGIFELSEGAGLERLGLKPGEVVGQSAFDLYKDYPDIVRLLKQTLAGHASHAVLEVGPVTLDVHYSPIHDGQGVVSGAVGVATDVTERKQIQRELEANQRRLAFLLDKSPSVIYSSKASGNFGATFMSANVTNQLGYLPEEFINDPGFWMEHIHPDDAPQILSGLEKLFAHGIHAHEYRFRHKNGQYLWMRDELTLIRDEAGEPTEIIGSWIDTTASKQAEDALRESRTMFKQILDTVPQSIFWKDKDSVYLGCNQVFAAAIGISSPEEIIGKTDFDLSWPRREAEAYRTDDAYVMANRTPKRHILEPLQQADGARLWIDTTKLPLVDGNGDVYGILGVYEDVTERKQAEQALRESEARYRQLFNGINDAVMVYDLEMGRFADCNEGVTQLLGYTRDEFLSLQPPDIVHPDFHQTMRTNQQRLNSGENTIVESLHHRKDGTTVQVEINSRLMTYQGARMILSVVRDITERKRAEKQLEESEQKYRQLIEALQEGIWVIDKDANTTFANSRMAEMLGYTVEEMQGKHLFAFMDERGARISKRNLERRQQGIKEQHDFEFIRKDGSRIYTAVETAPITDDKGNYAGAIAGVVDITERKQAEEKLQAAEAELRRIMQSISDYLWSAELDEQGQVTYRYYSPAAEKITGYPPEFFMVNPERWVSILYPDDKPHVFEAFGRLVSHTSTREEEEYRIVRADGQVRWVRDSVTAIPLTNGHRQLNGIVSDITERKRAEDALRESEERYRRLIETSPDAITLTDMGGTILFCNQQAALLQGLGSAEEMIGRNAFEFVAPENAQLAIDNMRKTLEMGSVKNVEYVSVRVDGTRFTVDLSASLILDAEGKPSALLGVVRDITERRRAEQALIASESQLNNIFNTTTDMQILMQVGPGERLIAQRANRSYIEAVKKLLPDLTLDVRGKERSELLKSFGFPVEGIELETLMYHEAIRTKAPVHFVNNLPTPLGDRILQVAISPVVDQQGTCTHALWSGRDVTEERRVEEALRENQTLLAASQAIAHVGSWDLEVSTKRLAWSDEVYRIFGVEPQEFDGTQAAFFEAVHPDDRVAVGEAYWSSVEQGRDSFEIEHRLVHKHTGETRHVHEKCIHVRNTAGAVVRSLGMVQDITERKKAEEALRQNEAIFSSFLEHSPVYVFFKDKNIRTLRLSRNYEQMLGMPLHEAIGKSMDELFPSPLAKSMVADDMRILKEGKRVDITENLNGRVYETTKFPIFIDGQPEMLAGFTIDVTERKRIENALEESQRRLSTALRATKVGVWEWDMRTSQAYWSDENYRLLGWEPGEVESRYENWAKAVHPEDLPEAEAKVAEAMNTRSELNIEFRVVWPDGSIHWINDIGSVLADESGQTLGMYGIQMDITERKHMEELLFEEKERAEITLHSIGDAVITVDINESVEYLNPVAENLTGWLLEDATGQPLDKVFRIIEEASRQPAISPVKRCLREGRVVGLANHSVLISRDGREYSIDDSAAPIRNRNGDMIGVVLVFHDVTEERRLSRKVAHDAMHDSLTGLVNRREFEKRLERALVTTKEQGISHVLCYLDLDQFKIVNDTAGHAAGDELLRQLSGLLGGLFRQRDTFARLGGDEFGLLLENCQLDQALVIANEIKAKIRNYPFVWAGHGFHVGVSIGVVPITSEKESVNQLMSQADVACYSAKDLGRDRVYIYHAGDSEAIQRHSEIIQAARMRDAIFQDRFRLFCQPIVQVTGEPSGIFQYEILLRMADHDGGLVFPAAFIPSAERYGEMQAIDRWVIRESFLAMAKHDTKRMLININLSGSSLDDDALPDYVLEQLEEFSIPPHHVCFEITETAAIRHLSKAQRFINIFRARGGRIALDDFGSGFSSFRYLKTLPVDYIKIDGGFVSDMLSNPGDLLMVEAITKIAHTLGIDVIAEHASGSETIDRLREIGVDYAQGFGIGLPVPVGEAWKSRG